MLESLPISSSTHVALLSLAAPPNIEFLAHGPTVLVLVAYFWRQWTPYLRLSRATVMTLAPLLLYGFCAELITLGGFTLRDTILSLLPVSVGVAISGLLLLSLRVVPQGTRSSLTLRDAIIIGCAQACALAPGISRLASTYVVGRYTGLSHDASFRFSCLLQVPLFGAAALKGLYGVWRDGQLGDSATVTMGGLIIGAMALAYLLLWATEYLMKTNRVWLLGGYLLVVAMVLFLHQIAAV